MAQKKGKKIKVESKGSCKICGVDRKLMMAIVAIAVVAIAMIAIVLLAPKGAPSKNTLTANVPVVATLVSDQSVSYDTPDGKYQITLKGGSGGIETGVESITVEVGKPTGDSETVEIPVSGVSVITAMSIVGDIKLEALSASESSDSAGRRQISAQVQLCYKCE